MARSQNSADFSRAESAMNYKDPESGSYSVTTNSHKRFGGKSNKIRFVSEEFYCREVEDGLTRREKRAADSGFRKQGHRGCVGSAWA